MFKNQKNAVRAILASGAVIAGNAMAAVPAEVSTALSDAKADGIVVATAVLIAIVAIYAFKLMRKGL